MREEGHVTGEDPWSHVSALEERLTHEDSASMKSFLLQDGVSESSSLRMLCKAYLGICG